MRELIPAALLFVGANLSSQTLHVDAAAAPGGDGASWAGAFQDVQSALDAAELAGGPHALWIAGGTYLPTEETLEGDPRSVSFLVPEDVSVFGGFAGTESSPGERDGTVETVLSGDLLADDALHWINRTDNAYHVVCVAGSGTPVTFDGLTIRGGNARLPLPAGVESLGGGMLTSSSFQGPLLRDVRFLENEAFAGGGLAARIPVQLEDCVFRRNRGLDHQGQESTGGAIYTDAIGSAVTATNTLFVKNQAGSGGAVSGFYAGFVAANCTFVDNRGYRVIGAVLLQGFAFLGLNNCILWRNHDLAGYGEDSQVWAPGLGDPQSAFLEHCCVEGWTGVYGGGGNTGRDPRFVDRLGPDGIKGSGDEDLRLSPFSPAVDAGRNAIKTNVNWPSFDSLPPADLEGAPRVVDGDQDADPVVDIGAYERPPRRFWRAGAGAGPVR